MNRNHLLAGILTLFGCLMLAAITLAQQMPWVPVTHADFTCPTQTAAASPNATASYQIIGTSTPVAGSYYPNRIGVIVSNVGTLTNRMGDSNVITATQGISIPAPPNAAGSPSPAPMMFLTGGSAIYCAGGGKLSVTEMNQQ